MRAARVNFLLSSFRIRPLSGQPMPRRPALYTEADVTRMIKAAKKNNLAILSIVLDGDKLTIRVSGGEDSQSAKVDVSKTVFL